MLAGDGHLGTSRLREHFVLKGVTFFASGRIVLIARRAIWTCFAADAAPLTATARRAGRQALAPETRFGWCGVRMASTRARFPADARLESRAGKSEIRQGKGATGFDGW